MLDRLIKSFGIKLLVNEEYSMKTLSILMWHKAKPSESTSTAFNLGRQNSCKYYRCELDLH